MAKGKIQQNKIDAKRKENARTFFRQVHVQQLAWVRTGTQSTTRRTDKQRRSTIFSDMNPSHQVHFLTLKKHFR